MFRRILLYVPAVMMLTTVLSVTAQKSKIRSGLIVLSIKTQKSEAAKVARFNTVIQNRCGRFGIRCRIHLSGQNGNQLSISFNSTSDLERVKELLLAEGLQVRAVDSKSFPNELREYSTRAEAQHAAGRKEVFPLIDESRQTYIVAEGKPIVTADDFVKCVLLQPSPIIKTYEIDCTLSPGGGKRLESWTGANINRYIAVIFNRRAMSVAYVMAPIAYNVALSGKFKKPEAMELANILESGNLPAPFEIVHEEITP